MEVDCMSSAEEEDYYSSDRDSLDGLENEESDSQWVPPKASSCKVYLYLYATVFSPNFCIRFFYSVLFNWESD